MMGAHFPTCLQLSSFAAILLAYVWWGGREGEGGREGGREVWERGGRKGGERRDREKDAERGRGGEKGREGGRGRREKFGEERERDKEVRGSMLMLSAIPCQPVSC